MFEQGPTWRRFRAFVSRDALRITVAGSAGRHRPVLPKPTQPEYPSPASVEDGSGMVHAVVVAWGSCMAANGRA
jgi:hypothetical protein